MVRAIRRWLDERGFLEVETPILQPLYGGALARPFTTHYNALDRDFFLRIADELYLKRLIVGGLERVYEIGKDFRNEGLSPKHNPEFTMLEWYEAYADYEDIAARLEELISLRGRPRSATTGRSTSPPPWRRITLRDAIKEKTGRRHRHRRRAAGRGDLGQARGHAAVEARRARPARTRPSSSTTRRSCRRSRRTTAREAGLVERFECFAAGMEFANAFTELNDPDEQRARFEQQRADQAAGDEETQPYDEDYISALEHGMPPTGGIGIGIDRLVMILSGRESIREVVLFPALRS